MTATIDWQKAFESGYKQNKGLYTSDVRLELPCSIWLWVSEQWFGSSCSSHIEAMVMKFTFRATGRVEMKYLKLRYGRVELQINQSTLLDKLPYSLLTPKYVS